MTRNPLVCIALGLTFGLFSETMDAQNAQCTLVTGSKAGQIVPVTINPAPPLNASCTVGSDRGYISRTSAPTNEGCECTLFTGPNAGREFPYNAALPLASACKVGDDRGYISKTSYNRGDTNFVCSVKVNGRTWNVPSWSVPPPGWGAPCRAGGVTGYVSRSASPVKPGSL
jgi:hypothetical protein